MKKFSIILAIMLVGMIAVQAQAVDTYWQGGTGNWSTAANWDNGEPTEFKNADINNGGTAQITQAGEACNVLTLGRLVGQSGNVELSGSGYLDTWEEFIGKEGTASFTQTGETNLSAQTIIALSSGSDATYHMYNGIFEPGEFFFP